MADEEHLKILKASCMEQNNCASWNQWRGKNPHIKIDLRGAALSEIDLGHVVFNDADLSHIILTRSRLRDSFLRGTHLRGAHLDYADFGNADLKGADLSRADLSGANFRNTSLSGSNLSGANLSDVILMDADLRNADLSRSHLVNVDLSSAHLADADLRGADLRGADLRGADLPSANLRLTDLSGANLSRADLSEVNLSHAELYRTNLSGTDLSEADLSGANLSAADLSGAEIRNVDFTGANLRNTDFTEVSIRGAIFADVDIRQCIGLHTVRHHGPSHIATDVFYRSKGEIPDIFLRGCGLTDELIHFVYAVAGAIQYYSVFISYNHQDDAFATRLYNDLQANNIRCWKYTKDVRIGDRIEHVIDQAIRRHDKLLVILSEHSVHSSWIADEVEYALKRESEEGKLVLFPVTIDTIIDSVDFGWASKIRRNRNIGDFCSWKDQDQYQPMFEHLLYSLKQDMLE